MHSMLWFYSLDTRLSTLISKTLVLVTYWQKLGRYLILDHLHVICIHGAFVNTLILLFLKSGLRRDIAEG